MRANIFERLSFLSLFLVVVLLPIFCLPFTSFAVETSKGLLLVVGLAASLIFWAIARFSDGKIVLPKSWLLLSGIGVILVTLLSALLSANTTVSLFGSLFDVSSFWFIFSAFVLMFLCSLVFRNPEQAKIILLGTILSSGLVLLFQSAHLFLPNILSLGILSGKTANILGSWNALGLFAGFACLMFLLVIEFFSVSKVEKIVLQVFVLLSILLAAAVNFSLVWILLGISSLIIFVYKLSVSFEEEKGRVKYFPVISFAVVIISLLFFMGGQFVGSFIADRLEVGNTEIGPSLGATTSVTWNVLKNHPILGIGPNRFGEAWSMYKPASINNTQFWRVYFDTGSGLLPTLMATTGALGLLSWLTFFVLFLYFGLRSVFSSIKNKVNWEMMAFFVLSLYLFVSAFLYFSGAVIFLLAFAFTGVFIGLAATNGKREISIAFLSDHRKSFFSILGLIIIVIFALGVSIKYIEKFASVSYFRKALMATDIPVAEQNIAKALALHSNDLYLRTYSQIYLLKLNSLATKGTNLSEQDKASLQNTVDQTVNGAQLAVAAYPSNYLNSQLLGDVYQALGSIGVKDAYGNAVVAYQNASKLNPLNPGLKLAVATSLLADGKLKDAKEYATLAISLKPDYIDALITLSQIAKREGNNTEALSYAEKALSLAPTEKSLIEYVNSLKNPTSTSSNSTTTE